MRLGWIVSLVGHVLTVLLTLVTWPLAATRDLDRGAIVPVEIVTLADITSVRPIASKDDLDAASVDQPAPEPTPAPEPAPVPPQAKERQRDDFQGFLGSVLRDVRKEKERPQRRVDAAETGGRARPAAGLGAAEAAALNDRLAALMREHVGRNRCWRAPADLDLTHPERLLVTVRFRLDARGRLQGDPQLVSPTSTFGDPHLRAAAETAIRAIRLCNPYPFADDPQARDHYDVWQVMVFEFDPSKLAN